MIKASEIKKGNVVDINGQPHVVIHLDVKTPSARGAATIYKIRFKNLVNGQSVVQSLKGENAFDEIACEKRPLQYLYADNENVTFMDNENYAQYALAKTDLEYERGFMKEGQEDIIGLISDEKLLTIELPSTVVLTIEECPPAMKAASASARTKPATLETGIVVQVPEYMDQGESIVVNTETKEYVSKA
jgi:elongation factor P